MSRETIVRDGKRFVLVPEEVYERMIDDLDDLDDIRAYDAAKAKPQEFIPFEITKRILSGENPVRVWREHRGMTQQKLAEAAGISKAYLSQIEAEVRGGSVAVLSKLAKALSVDLDDLVAPQR
jgi:DNA-binding XRE family transcriptional regulator